MVLPKTGFMPEMELEWKIPQWSNAIERAARAHVPPGVLGARRALQPRAGAQGGPRRPDEVVERLHGAGVRDQRRLPRGRARRALAPHGHPRGQDRQLPAVPADAVERQPARRPRDAGPLRGRGPEHADLRGERTGELQGRSTSCARSTRSTRACPAACTCTARARSARSSTRRRGCVEHRLLRGADRARPGADRPARGGPGPPGPRGGGRAGRVDHAALRRGARADLRRARRGARDPRPADRRRRRREPDADPRALPGRPGDARAARRSRPCGRTWSRMAATSSCSASRTASRGCARRALQRLPGVGGDARARDRDGDRGGRARPRRPRGRGGGRARAGARADGVRAAGPERQRVGRPAGVDGARDRRAGRRRHRAGHGRGRRPPRGERRRHAAGVPQRVRRAAARGSTARR